MTSKHHQVLPHEVIDFNVEVCYTNKLGNQKFTKVLTLNTENVKVELVNYVKSYYVAAKNIQDRKVKNGMDEDDSYMYHLATCIGRCDQLSDTFTELMSTIMFCEEEKINLEFLQL